MKSAAKPQPPSLPPESPRRVHAAASQQQCWWWGDCAFVSCGRYVRPSAPRRAAFNSVGTPAQARDVLPANSPVQTASNVPTKNSDCSARARISKPTCRLCIFGLRADTTAGSRRAVYQFAAEHPEILSYVPCYCGCEHSGHRGNEDCFVKARSADGDVVEWEDHGMECAVCIDVAQRSMQMYTSGASVRDIRAAIEKEWNPRSPTHTPTPAPPPR